MSFLFLALACLCWFDVFSLLLRVRVFLGIAWRVNSLLCVVLCVLCVN